jgi:MFS family permease
VSDRFGPLVAMRLGSALGLAALVAYALAPDVTVLWVAAIAAGAGSASIDVGIASVVSDQTSLSARAAAMAGWNAITGARGIVAAFTMSILLQIGIVDVTSGPAALRGVSGHRGRPVRPGQRGSGRRRPSVEPSRVTRVVHGCGAPASR